MQFWNSVTLLAASYKAKAIGEHELADELLTRLIDYHELEPQFWGDLDLAIAYALAGEKANAINVLNRAYDDGDETIGNMRWFRLEEDPYDVYHGIGKDVGFIDVMKRFDQRSQEVLMTIQRSNPELFPSEASQ